jgi:hypothetical protein
MAQQHFNALEGQQTMSFDASKYTKSKWLHGADLTPGQNLTLTINEASEHTFDDGSKRPVVSFLEIEQSLALNKTQTATLIALFGANAGGWAMQRVDLMAVPSNYAGKPTIIVRAAVPTFNGQQMGQLPAAAPATTLVEPAMTGGQGDDARRLWETQQAPAAPHTASGVTFR